MRATYPSHLNLLDLIFLIFDKEYKLKSSSLLTILHTPVK
jgi:hypothetical protein